MNNRKNIILVRSSKELIEDGFIGYGWNNIDFSAYQNKKDLFKEGFKGIDIGRKRKQIQMFYSLEKDDIVLVPVAGAVAIGIVEGTKIYQKTSKIKNSSNRVKIDFFKNKKSEVLYIPRTQLGTDLERRLKIRTSIANLENWNSDITGMVSDLEKGNIPTWDSTMIDKEEKLKDKFIQELEERLRTEKGLGISAGGYGLEKLIKEIFQAKGYDSEIPSKQSRPVGEDVDIIARKEGEFIGEKGEIYLIQAKHHRGTTSRTGLEQLIKCEDDKNEDNYIYKKVLITTASVSDVVKREAKEKSIVIVEGKQLAIWVYENLEMLSSQTIRSLGIGLVPTLI